MTTHSEMVHVLTKPGADILESMTADKAHLMHMMMGVSGEVGELLDSIKKHVAYNKPLDYAHIVEELGDIEYYLEGLRQGLNLDRVMILEHNVSKLSKRYPGLNYSDAAAQTRADKISQET